MVLVHTSSPPLARRRLVRMIEELPGLGVVHTVSMEIIEHILQPAVVLFGRIAE
jgi:hypothetical protein